MPTLLSAQDVMANFVTPDVQLKSATTAKIVKEVASAKSISIELDRYAEASRELYGDCWSSAGLHIYKGMSKPREFTIILDADDPRFKYSEPMKRTMITSNYGYRARFHRNHYGIDLKGYIGDTIYAAYAGKVRVKRFDANGFGNYVVLRHENGLETVYGHMTRQLVEVDQEVKSGEPIGLCGNTGRSFGSHLHFEMRLLGEAIDPAKLVDIANHCVQTDTYVYRSGNNSVPVATPIPQQAAAPKPEPAPVAKAPVQTEKKVEKPAPVEKKTEQPAAKSNNYAQSKPKAAPAIAETKKATPTQAKQATKTTAKEDTKSKAMAKKPAPKPASTSYTVQKGESLSSISKKTGIPVAELAKSNNIKGDMIREGQTLKIKK